MSGVLFTHPKTDFSFGTKKIKRIIRIYCDVALVSISSVYTI